MTWAQLQGSWTQLLLACIVATVAVPGTALADLYSFTDSEGVVHFTNIPSQPKARPHRMNDRVNTFSWKDDLGRMRRVHRVDVNKFDNIIKEAAAYYSLPPALIKAVIAAESAFEPKATSSAGAHGLMQLMPKTAQAMQVTNVFEPRDNIFGGTRYLRHMANRFDGDIRLTVASYNAGPKAVESAKNRVPLIEETQTYVRRVLKLYNHYLEHWTATR